jgi:ribose transport system permease protein
MRATHLDAAEDAEPAGSSAVRPETRPLTSARQPARRTDRSTAAGSVSTVVARGTERYGLVALLAAMVALFALLPASGEAFRSSANIQSVLANQAVGLTVALALLMPLAAGHFDFSVGATTALSCVVSAAVMATHGASLVAGVAAGLGTGLVVGLLLGVMVAYGAMNSFIATLGMATLIGGGIFAYTDGLQITGDLPVPLTDLGSRTLAGVPAIVWVAAAIGVAAWFLTKHTPLGVRLYAVGSNAEAAKLVGINVRGVTVAAFAMSGLLSGAAGVLLLARQGSATSENGMTMLFPALTAVLLSTVVLEVGRPSVLGVVVGVLFVAVSVSGLTLAGAPVWISQVFNGAALLLAVAIASFGRRIATRSGP